MTGLSLLAALQKTDAYKSGKIVVVDESKDFKEKIKEVDEAIEKAENNEESEND